MPLDPNGRLFHFATGEIDQDGRIRVDLPVRLEAELRNLLTGAVRRTAGQESHDDDVKVIFGTGDDVELYFDGTDLILACGDNNIKIQTTTNLQIIDSAGGPGVLLISQEATPAADTVVGNIQFRGADDGGAESGYARMRGLVTDDSAGLEDGYLDLSVVVAGTMTPGFRLEGNGLALGASPSAPTSRLDVNGSFALPTKTITNADSPYTATADDFMILADASSGAITVALPAASGVSGRVYCVKKIDSSGNNVTIDPDGSETLDGATTRILSSQWSLRLMICDGSAWFRMD